MSHLGVMAASQCPSRWMWWSDTLWVTLTGYWPHSFLLCLFWFIRTCIAVTFKMLSWSILCILSLDCTCCPGLWFDVQFQWKQGFCWTSSRTTAVHPICSTTSGFRRPWCWATTISAFATCVFTTVVNTTCIFTACVNTASKHEWHDGGWTTTYAITTSKHPWVKYWRTSWRWNSLFNIWCSSPAHCWTSNQ